MYTLNRLVILYFWLGNSLRAKKQPAKEESGNKPKPVQLPINDFYVEYARPGKGPCGCCQKTINVGEICVMKVSHMELRSDAWYHHGGWYHVACFTEHRIQFGWLLSGEKLPGFKRLKDKDKAELKQRIPWVNIEYFWTQIPFATYFSLRIEFRF